MTSTAALVRTGEPEEKSSALAVSRAQLQILRPIAQPGDIIKAQDETRTFVHAALKEGRDFGVIPGTDKSTLLKPGAERVANGFGCTYGEPVIVDKEIDHDREVNWAKKNGKRGVSYGIYRYVLKVPVVELSSGRIVGWGAGAASTMESKYVDRPRDSENTVFKMAAKRARIDACLTTFGLSDEFTQDVEDVEREPDEQPTVQTQTPAPKPMTLDEARAVPFPWKKPPKYAGKPLGELSYNMLTIVRDGVTKQAAEHGPQSKSAEVKRACDLLIEAYEEGEQRMGPTISTSGGSSPNGTNGNSASTHVSSPDASDLPDEDDADDEDYVDELTPAEHDEPKPPPAEGAEDSVYRLAKRLRQLIEHPSFPEEFRDTTKLDMRTKAGKPKYGDWLQRTVKAAEDLLAGMLEPDQLNALGIVPR